MTDTTTVDARANDSHDWLEIATTVVLSLAAALIAWAAYQGALWGGVQDTRGENSRYL